ncbi:site-specific DNA recombinase [Streptacidiphilus sp. MAP12-33]|uniref:recombinase family protein n=1 Tax=Streptacidiphilus sp. MAP12-33 TaxID=3156266 RepID=UPI003516EA36
MTWSGGGAAYLWVPGLREADQTGVVQQERLARQEADRLGVPLPTAHVFADVHLSAWANGAVPGAWRAMIEAARAGRFAHLFLHRAERLERIPHALLELLDTADRFGLSLHGHPRDLDDPAVRYELRAEATAGWERRRKQSDLMLSAHQNATADGRSHGGGLRPYGYTPGMGGLVDHEVAVVREIHARYLAGLTRRSTAVELIARGIPTATGKQWTVSGVTRILDAPRYAGLLVVRGEIATDASGRYLRASWPACVPVEAWEQVRRRRLRESEERVASQRPRRFYPLTTLLVCDRCERAMVGDAIDDYRTYACSSASSLAQGACSRHIAAEPLEAFLAEEAIRLLEGLDRDLLAFGGPATARRGDRHGAHLADPRAAHRRVTALPTGVMDGVVTGPGARFGWHRLPRERQAAVLHRLFGAVRIAASTTPQSVFDTTRIRPVERGAS